MGVVAAIVLDFFWKNLFLEILDCFLFFHFFSIVISYPISLLCSTLAFLSVSVLGDLGGGLGCAGMGRVTLTSCSTTVDIVSVCTSLLTLVTTFFNLGLELFFWLISSSSLSPCKFMFTKYRVWMQNISNWMNPRYSSQTFHR